MARLRQGAVVSLLALCPSCSCGGRPAATSGAADLTVYAAQGAEITTPVLDAYQGKHPRLKIDVIRAGTGEMLARIRAEKENPLGDVLWGGSLETFAANADLFAPGEAAEAGWFPATDPARKWHPFTTNVIYLVINAERVQDAPPAAFRDLADPRWQRLGKIALSNPAASGTGYTIVTALVTAHGWDFMADLLRNCRLTDSSDSMFKWVKDGETAAGFLFETTLQDYLVAGAPLRPVLTAEGLITQTDGFGMIAGTKHPRAAAELMSYLASEEAHEVVRTQVGRRSARRGIAAPPALLDIGGRPLIHPDPGWAAYRRSEILAKFDEARAKAGQ